MPDRSAKHSGIHAVTRGEQGGHLVFIHGAGGSRLIWDRQVVELSGAYRVTAVDLPGHGRSGPPGRRTIGEYAVDVATYLTKAGSWPAVLVGHSMGGAIALTVALEQPELVSGLVLVSTGARLRVSPVVLEGLVNDSEAAMKLINDFAFGPDAGARLREVGESAIRKAGPETLLGDLRACDAFDAMGRLSSVGVPALVICGTEDRLTPIKYAGFLASGIPGARLETVDGAGHMVMLERPAAVSQAIGQFAATL